MPFQRRRKCIFYWRGRAWLTIWDRVKIPRYSHRLMHRKRVTCELHDSYFRLMTIKHAIPKTVEVHIPMASYREILSGRELLYNRVTGNSIGWRQGAVEKDSTLQRELSGPRSMSFWGSDELEIRCGRENQHPERLGPRPQAPGWAALENGKETLMAIRVGVNMLQFCSVSNSLSHTTLSNKVRGIFSQRTVSLVFIIVSLWFCMHM